MPRSRVLTQQERNRALLARQMLLEHATVSVPRALERMGTLQNQYAPSGYIGLWSRVAGFKREHLTRALERRQVVQGTLMRATIHLVSRRDYWPLLRAVEDPLLDWWFRTTKRHDERTRLRAIDRKGRRLLSDGPRRRWEIVEALGLDASDWVGVGLFTPAVRVPPSGTWEQRRADRYANAEDWIGPSDGTAESGRELLVRRYLAAYGPASRADITSFTGLPPTILTPVLERLPLRRFADEADGELLDVRGAPLPDPDSPAPVRFLPWWDATLLVHARRTGIVPEEFRPQIFNVKTPHSVGTVLVDGSVRATWRLDGTTVRWEPLEPLPRAVRREIDAEAAALTAFCS